MSGDAQETQLISHQLELERLYNKNQTISRIRKEFLNSEIEFSEVLIEHDIPVEFGITFLVQMAIHKRPTLETMVGILFHHLEDSQKTVDLLMKLVAADFADYDTEFKTFTVIFDISEETQDELDRFQYPLPMVVVPQPIKNNMTSGYYTHQSSVILRDNHTEDDVCLDHLNRVNAIRLTVNLDTANMIHNKWKNLDKAKVGEEHEAFMARKKAFLKYDRTSKEVMELLMQHNDVLHLTHRYDKRGRTYCQGYHVNYQGTPWNKAVIEFADKELVE